MILHLYFGRRFLTAFAGLLAVFTLMLGFFDLIEHLRRYSDDGATMSDLVPLILLNLPSGLYQILPLLVILATITLFLSLARSSELVVSRAAGRSALRALLAPVLGALLIGGLAVAMVNPIVAATSAEYESRINALRADGQSVLALSPDAVYLRQGGDEGQTVIRAERANLDGTELSGVTFLSFAPDGGPLQRIEAARARLVPGAWEIANAKVWPLAGHANPEALAATHATLTLPSTLTADEIRDSFGTPSSIPIWELPRFIDRLQEAGFSASRHEVWLQMELALPAFLVAMVLIGAGFTMRHQRGGRTGAMVMAAILVSFGLYFLRNFTQVLGENGDLPVVLAAWAPPLAAIGLALGLLLHLEDG